MTINDLLDIFKINSGYFLFSVIGSLLIGFSKLFKYKYFEKEKKSYHGLFILYCLVILPIFSTICLFINLDSLDPNTKIKLSFALQLGVSAPIILNSILVESSNISTVIKEQTNDDQ